MYISIRSAFTTNPELYTEAIAQKLVLFRALVNGTDDEFTSALNSFNKAFNEATIKSENSIADKKFILFYTWLQVVPVLLVQGVKEVDFNTHHIKYYYELDMMDNLDNTTDISTAFFTSAREYYKSIRSKDEYSAFIQQCIDYINENIYEKFDLEDLASKLHYNSYYLSKKFKKETNMSVSQFVLQAKISEARVLLEKNNSIKTISDKLAFSSQSYFTECFKKSLGITPKQYQYLIKK